MSAGPPRRGAAGVPPQPGSGDTGNRLERALAALLAARPTTRAEQDKLLRDHPDLVEVLAPMLQGGEPEPALDGRERVLGDFRLVRELGRGGMGIVYEAWQRSLDRRVAVKVLAPALLASPSAIARFRREANAAGRLRHPHIVEVLGFGSEGNEHWFAMQFIDGAPLHDVAARCREPRAAVALCARLADALAHAHAAGVVHRDVKPGNVLVRADGTPMLTDFGVARDESLPSLTREGGFVGTVDYASPEQVRGEEVDARSDLWSLGVMLHELLAGAHPFSGPTQEATLHRVLTAEPPRLLGRPGIGNDLAAVVDRALAKRRDDRYQTATALRDDLRALERGEPVSARLPTATERLRRWARREPWRAVVAGVLLVGVPALTGIGGYLWANAPRIEAAAAAERALAREERLGDALATAHAGTAHEGLAILGPARPDEDIETLVVRAILHRERDENDVVDALLQGRTEPVAAAVRQLGSARTAKIELPEHLPDDPLECYALAQLLVVRRIKYSMGSRALATRAVDLAAKAAQLTTPPKLTFLLTWLAAADLAGDRAALDTAAAALATHFPRSAVARMLRARHTARVWPERALALADALIAENGESAPLCIARGLALEHLDRLDEAVAANRRATELNPASDQAWGNLSATLRKGKHAAEAVAAAEQATRLQPGRAPFWNLLGLARRDAGDLDGAVEAFTTALECSPQYAPAAQNLGNLRARAKNFEGAVEMLRLATANDSNNVPVAGNLADALSILGRDEEALPHAMRAVQLAPEDFLAHRILARIAGKLQLHVLAAMAARRMAELRPTAADGPRLLAEALLAQQPSDPGAALAAARDAVARAPDDPAARVLVARALTAGGDRDGAAAALRAALAEPGFGSGAARERLQRALDDLAGK